MYYCLSFSRLGLLLRRYDGGLVWVDRAINGVLQVKHEVKARLTTSAAGPGGEGPRGWIQVLANSIVASVLIVLHGLKIAFSDEKSYCYPSRLSSDDILVWGIVG